MQWKKLWRQLERAELQEIVDQTDYYKMQVLRFDEEAVGELLPQVREAMLMSLKETIRKYCHAGQHMGREFLKQVESMTQLEDVIDMAANSIPLYYTHKQQVLEAVNLTQRYEVFMGILLNEIEVMAIRNDLIRIKKTIFYGNRCG